MKHLPTAPHSYFRIKNIDEARRKFLADPGSSPVFFYADVDSGALQSMIEAADHSDNNRIRLSLELVAASIALRNEKSESRVAEYRRLNEQLYGEPDAEYAFAILSRAIQKASDKRDDIVAYISDRIQNIPDDATVYRPDAEIFKRLKGYIRRYVDFEQFDKDQPLDRMLVQSLVVSGLNNKGWTIEIKDDSRHAVTIQSLKKIVIGQHYQPRSEHSKMQIMLHEVYGHAIRGPQSEITESEGFAGLLEQLVYDHYASRRSYRFLAAALGWGSVGQPMNFREVYEILWRVMAGGEYYSDEDAKIHAFSECARVFRGSDPSIAGAVFLKDSLYFKANIEIWKTFEQTPPTYEEFVEILEGKRKVLS
jgi:hypothetical protein